jgi:hypothetical protein
MIVIPLGTSNLKSFVRGAFKGAPAFPRPLNTRKGSRRPRVVPQSFAFEGSITLCADFFFCKMVQTKKFKKERI